MPNGVVEVFSATLRTVTSGFAGSAAPFRNSDSTCCGSACCAHTPQAPIAPRRESTNPCGPGPGTVHAAGFTREAVGDPGSPGAIATAEPGSVGAMGSGGSAPGPANT